MAVSDKDIEKWENKTKKSGELHASIYSSDGKKEDITPVTVQNTKKETEDESQKSQVDVQIKVDEVEGQAQEVQKVQETQKKPEKQKKEKKKEKVITDNDETWKHKFEVSEGRNKADIPRLHAQIGEYQKEIDGLKDLIVNAQKVQPIKKTEPKIEPEFEPEKPVEIQVSQGIGNKYIAEGDVDKFGQETIDLATRIASGIVKDTLTNYDIKLREGINNKFIKYDQKLTPIVQDINAVKGTQIQVAQDWFSREMRQKVQDYDLHANSPDFKTWLDQPDAKHGDYTNRAFFDAYKERGNTDGAAQIFSDYFKAINTPETIETLDSGEQINETMATNLLESDEKSIQRPMIYNENNVLVYADDGTPVVAVNITDNVVKTTNFPLNQISPAVSIAGDESEGLITPEKPLVHMSDLTNMVLQLSKNPGSVSDVDFQKKKAEINLARLENRLVMP